MARAIGVTDDVKAQFKALYEANVPMEQIGARFNLTGKTVMYHLDRMGVYRKGKRLVSDEEKAETIRLYEANVSHDEIGAHFGVTGGTIMGRLRSWGVTRRGPTRRRFTNRNGIDEQDVIATYREYRSTAITATVYGVSCPTIVAVLKRNGVKLISESVIERICAEKDLIHEHYYVVRASLEELAAQYEVSLSCMSNMFWRWGWKARDATFADTSIERWVMAELEGAGLPFEKQFKLGRKLYDLCVPSHRLLIECNGDYWHANPLVYPDDSVLDDTQRQGRCRDRIKTELARKHGYLLLFLWENDIKNRPEVARAKLGEALFACHPPVVTG